MASVVHGQLKSHVVGRQYYTGLTSVCECIELRREPSNTHDANAISVYNSSFEKTGHLPRWLAEILAPCIDTFVCTVNGTVAGVGNAYTTPVHLSIVAPVRMAEQLRAHLGSYWYLWQMDVRSSTSRPDAPLSMSLHDDAMQLIADQITRSSGKDRILVITTARGIQSWVNLSNSRPAMQALGCLVFKRSLADPGKASSQVTLAHFSDAALAVTRSGPGSWSMVVLDRTSIRDECESVDLAGLFGMLDLGIIVFI
ncbi:hypothetical protein EC988_001416 [Linderina pennispora]|nr:hypothetical protein EC988_001416 [Linderina pennispora]